VITPDQTKAFVSRFQTTNSVVVIDLTTSPPSLAGGVNPISTSTQGLDLTLSGDGQYLILGDGSAAASPLTVINVATMPSLARYRRTPIGIHRVMLI
jgi:hypothetical protein